MSGELVLKLFHGRDRPDEVLTDWGFDGPALGPLESVSLTYGVLEICTANECHALPLINGLVHYDGKFYGDVSVTLRRLNHVLEPFDVRRAVVSPHLLARRVERSPVRVAVERFLDYQDIIAVFLDAIRERCDEPTASSVALALSNVVRRR